MNTDLLTQIDADFLLAEYCLTIVDPEQYVEKVSQGLRAAGPSRLLGNALIMIEKKYGQCPLAGFLFTLAVLERFSVKQGNIDWLSTQFNLVHTMGSEEVGKYVIPFLTDPVQEILRLTVLTANLPFYDFLLHEENRWPGFILGSLFLIGILLFADESNHKQDITVVQE